MSTKKFDTLQQFRKWANLNPGDTLTLPFGSSKGWSVIVRHEEVEIDSSFYRVAAGGKYGAAMIHGHAVPFFDKAASGIIEFGLDDAGKVVVANRRRLTSEDTFDKNTHEFVGVIVGQPDRVLEPVAVIIHGSAVAVLNRMTDEERLALYDRVGDALELEAVRALLRKYPPLT